MSSHFLSITLLAILTINRANAWYCIGGRLYCYNWEIQYGRCPAWWQYPCYQAPTPAPTRAPIYYPPPPPTITVPYPTTPPTTPPPTTTTMPPTTAQPTTDFLTTNHSETCPVFECCHFNCRPGAGCTQSSTPTAWPTCSDGLKPTMCASLFNPFSTYCLDQGCDEMSCHETMCMGVGELLLTLLRFI
ncbi:hypothetical protein Fcan01_11237 [Folsomia candida]|uniref:Uncharacterized protein n=1 Tax=Folsomia candida TaxID=158441 RepID=A0A226E9X9_FOLCA|nr:hypothetical protein Fcan01_11237 [Folsomia candida]